MRLTNFLLVAASYGYAPVRGAAAHPPRAPERILVAQTGKLGDMVCSTPVLRALRSRFPNAHITTYGMSAGRQILAGNPASDGYIESEKNFFVLLKNIRQNRFDAAILLTPDTRALALAFLGGVRFVAAPRVVDGFCPWMTKSYRSLLTLVADIPHHIGHYTPQEYLNMLEPLGIDPHDTRKELFVTEQAQATADALLAPCLQKVKVAIAPGAGNKIKEWPPEKFNEVAKELVRRWGALIVIVGGSADIPLAQIVAKDLPQGSVLDTTGTFSIEELKGLVKRMDLFVSADTGPIYIAEAFHVPTVDIVGPVDEREQPPRGVKHLVVVPKRDKAALHIMNARVYDEAEARRQAHAASVQEVISAIERIL